MNIIIPNKPFYQMDLQELRAYFIKVNGKLERKRKTRRKYKTKRRKLRENNLALIYNVRWST